MHPAVDSRNRRLTHLSTKWSTYRLIGIVGFLERTSAAAEIPRCIMVRSSAARSAFDPRCEWGSITSSANRRSPTPACFLNHENQVLALKQLILEFRRSTCI